jgi:hypothetical protein
MPSLPSRWRAAFSRSWVLLLVTIGHLLATAFFHHFEAAVAGIRQGSHRALAAQISQLQQNLFQHSLPLRLLLGLLVVALLLRALQAKPLGWGMDLLGGLLVFRSGLQFGLENLLLLAPFQEGVNLLSQLLLFLPVVTIAFGWLYLRLDSGARRFGRRHIQFDGSLEPIDPFDYFHVAAVTLLQFEPSGAKATTRLMKTLFVLHGVVMLDLVALVLSRAIGLASGG